MTDQIASITLRADVSDLKTASNELDKLGQAAAGAVDKADDLNSVFRAGAESAKHGSEGLKEQQNALKGLLENIDPVTKALNRLDEQQESLRKFQAKGFLDTDTFQAYNKILDDTRLKLTDTGEAAAKAQAELAATQAAEKQSAALKNLLGSIDPTIRAFNSLDEQHAQLVAHFEPGRINGAQFEHFSVCLAWLTCCQRHYPDRKQRRVVPVYLSASTVQRCVRCLLSSPILLLNWLVVSRRS